jgi:uncharacterized repeat protein (TIGR02543 family)
LNDDTTTAKTMSVKKLISKAYPVISASTKDTDLTLTISNPEDNNEDFEIVGFKVTGTVTSASFNDSTITSIANMNDEIEAKKLSLADGDKTELILAAGINSTVQVTAITIRIDGNEVTIDSDYTNVGKWSTFKVSAGDKGSAGGDTPKDYVVSYNSNGGSDVANQMYNNGQKITTLPTPTKDGYTLAGWFKESELTNEWDTATDTVTSNITLYAKWTLDTLTAIAPTISSDQINVATTPTKVAEVTYTYAIKTYPAGITDAEKALIEISET